MPVLLMQHRGATAAAAAAAAAAASAPSTSASKVAVAARPSFVVSSSPAAAAAPRRRRSIVAAAAVASDASGSASRVIRGKCFVTKDNIDTDQIIPAEYLTLVPSKPDEYEKLGSYALIGLPEHLYPTRFVAEGEMKTEYPIVVGGDNFGCGSSREHAPVAMGAAGARVVVAESYARIFFRNCVATGELYPSELADGVRICDELTTGQEVVVDLDKDTLTVVETGKTYPLKPLGDAGPVIDAGGIFEYARRQGMIKTA